ncbi:MAG: PilT/PilU family type 4a pilus ATPase [Oscillospiraceae bacterium]|nr:PilT/PilU family type 4a pilus ATPase [Oscillospiraceae bacterium]
MDAENLLRQSVEMRASDVFIGAGRQPFFKIEGVLVPQGGDRMSAVEAEDFIRLLYAMANRPIERFKQSGDDDFPVAVPGVARFRVNAYMQRGTAAAIIRVVAFEIPDYKTMRIPEEVMHLATEKRGLLLVTGTAGSGKTTTLACIIDAINQARNCHIVTLEDPIEYLQRDKKSLISQREISADTESYMSALRASLRQAPDIILLGEMRDFETIRTAMTAAETGHLVISTLHTVGAVTTLDRVIDVFPPDQQQQIRIQLSMVLVAVASQRLIPDKNGGLIPTFEIMRLNSAIRNLIREGKTHQIDSVIQTSAAEGMVSMDSYMVRLFKQGLITAETALENAVNEEQMKRRLDASGI